MPYWCSVPSPLGNLVLPCATLPLSHSLTGQVPDFVGPGSQLTLLRIYGNSFTGELSEQMFRLGTLSSVAAYRNELEGTLPSTVGWVGARMQLEGRVVFGCMGQDVPQRARGDAAKHRGVSGLGHGSGGGPGEIVYWCRGWGWDEEWRARCPAPWVVYGAEQSV